MSILWRANKLGDVCEVEYGTRVVNKRDGGNKYPVYGGGGATFFMDEFNREDRMVIARFAMSEKCTRYVKGKFFLNDSGLTVLSKDQKKLSQDFLDLQLIYLNDKIYELARGSAQKNLNVPAFRNLAISYPESLSEQKRIVSILDKSFEVIEKTKENTEKNLQNTEEIFDSFLQNIFKNETHKSKIKNLKDVCIKITDGAHHSPKKLYAEKMPGNFPYITSKNIRNDGMDLSNVKYVDEEFHKTIYSSCAPSVGDVLLTKDGANTGNVTLNILNEPFSLLSSVALLKTDREQLLPDFLKFYIQSPIGFRYITGKMTGAAIKRIILKNIKNAVIPIPSILNQEKIIENLNFISLQCKKLEEINKQKLLKLHELKQSLLRKAFNGEL